MEFDLNNLYIAGVTNTTEYDTPDIVFAYPSETAELPDGFTPDPDYFRGGDVIIVGPLGADGLIDMSRATVYEVCESEGSLTLIRKRLFSWVNKLATYQPLSNLELYIKGAEAQWEANKVVDL